MMTIDSPASRTRQPISVFRHIAFAVLFLICVTTAGLTDAKSPINIVSGDSVRAMVNAEVLVQVLRKAGFKAQSTLLSADKIPSALASGAVQILPEISLDQLDRVFAAQLKAGTVIDIGSKQARSDDPKYRKLAWSKTRRRWTNEFKLIKNMTIPEQDVQDMVDKIRNDDGSVSDVVTKWIGNNKDRWGKWVSVSRNWMKP